MNTVGKRLWYRVIVKKWRIKLTSLGFVIAVLFAFIFTNLNNLFVPKAVTSADVYKPVVSLNAYRALLKERDKAETDVLFDEISVNHKDKPSIKFEVRKHIEEREDVYKRMAAFEEASSNDQRFKWLQDLKQSSIREREESRKKYTKEAYRNTPYSSERARILDKMSSDYSDKEIWAYIVDKELKSFLTCYHRVSTPMHLSVPKDWKTICASVEDHKSKFNSGSFIDQGFGVIQGYVWEQAKIVSINYRTLKTWDEVTGVLYHEYSHVYSDVTWTPYKRFMFAKAFGKSSFGGGDYDSMPNEIFARSYAACKGWLPYNTSSKEEYAVQLKACSIIKSLD